MCLKNDRLYRICFHRKYNLPFRNSFKTVACWVPGKLSSSAEPWPVKCPTAIWCLINAGCLLRNSSSATVWNLVRTSTKPIKYDSQFINI